MAWEVAAGQVNFVVVAALFVPRPPPDPQTGSLTPVHPEEGHVGPRGTARGAFRQELRLLSLSLLDEQRRTWPMTDNDDKPNCDDQTKYDTKYDNKVASLLFASTNYIPPSHEAEAFNCPHCGVYADQEWSPVSTELRAGFGGGGMHMTDYSASFCRKCTEFSLWFKGGMFHPDLPGVPIPNPDLPEPTRVDYLEAASITNRSPRGAAALLRLCVQKLCVHLGEKGKLNDAIGNLVKRGLPERVQQAMDIVRVTGNEAVHPGRLDLKDDRETAVTLFGLLNFIADRLITQERTMDALFESLPESKKKQIQRRDRKKE